VRIIVIKCVGPTLPPDRASFRRKLDEKRVLDVREYVKTIEDRLEDEIKVSPVSKSYLSCTH
jgi:hypothetical protein